MLIFEIILLSLIPSYRNGVGSQSMVITKMTACQLLA